MNIINNDNNNNLIFIRSNHILKQIMVNLSTNKLLDIIRYNKKLQNNLNKNIDFYKEYTNIEIEIIPKENQSGDFINISKENKSYCHIYFDEENSEIKRNYFTQNDMVKKIKVVIESKIKSFNELFRGCEYLENIKFIKFNRKDITDMSHMFIGCSSLKELNLKNFNTNKVINMQSMFAGCSSLVKLNLSNFNTNNVTGCSLDVLQLKKLKYLILIQKM